MLAVDDAGGDGIDVDAVGDQIQPRRLGQADDRRLAGTIDRDQRFAASSGLAGHVDDLAPDTMGDHVARYGLHREERAFDVHIEDARVVLGGDLDYGRGREQRGIVYQDVDGRKAVLFGKTDRIVDAVQVGDIHANRQRVVAAQGQSRFRRAPLVDVGDDHPRAFGQVGRGEGPPDSAGGAGYQGCLARQTHQSILRPCASNLCSLSSCGVR